MKGLLHVVFGRLGHASVKPAFPGLYVSLLRALSHTSLAIIAVYFAVAVTHVVVRHEVWSQEVTSVWGMFRPQNNVCAAQHIAYKCLRSTCFANKKVSFGLLCN